MTQYLQRLIARAAGGAQPQALVPSVRTPFDAAGTADPFEKTAALLPQPSAGAVPGGDLPARGEVPGKPATGPVGGSLPAVDQSPEGSAPVSWEPPAWRSEPASAARVRPANARPASAARESTRCAPEERPLPVAPTPPLEAATPVPAAAHGPVRPTARSASPRRPGEPATSIRAALPAAEQPLAERAGPELRPTPPPAPAMPRPAESPRVAIGHLSVEVVPAPPPAPPSTLARPAAGKSTTPSRNDAPSSPLRFGLGQM